MKKVATDMNNEKPVSKQEKFDSKLAALGNKKELLPLKSLGFALFDCKNLQEAKDLIKNLNSKGCELVIIAEDIVEGNQTSFLEIIKNFPLAVLVLPQLASLGQAHQGGYKVRQPSAIAFGVGRKNFAKNTVKKIIKEAVGF